MKRLIGGPRAVEEALRSRASQLNVLFYAADMERGLAGLLEMANRARVRVEPRQRSEMDALAGDLRHQGVLAVTGEYPYATLEDLLDSNVSGPLLVALDQIQDPHNLGAIVRSAVALGAQGIITLQDRAAPVTAVAVRASAGATEQARIARVTNLARSLQKLREHDFEIVGLDGEAPVDLESLPFPPTGRVLVVGSEGTGLRPLVRKQCDFLARIPLPGPIASLNASVAAGIAIYESCRKRTMAFTG